MNRPPFCGTRLRISPNSGSTPEMSTRIVFFPMSTLKLEEYSGEIDNRSLDSFLTRSRSSSVTRILLPLLMPSKGSDVLDGHAMTILSPRPAKLLLI